MTLIGRSILIVESVKDIEIYGVFIMPVEILYV